MQRGTGPIGLYQAAAAPKPMETKHAAAINLGRRGGTFWGATRKFDVVQRQVTQSAFPAHHLLSLASYIAALYVPWPQVRGDAGPTRRRPEQCTLRKLCGLAEAL